MFREFNRQATIHEGSGGSLPHWRQRGVTYFVTFRLADSMPEGWLGPLREQKRTWLLEHPRPWTKALREEFERRFTVQVQAWLDSGAGSCLFADPVARKQVEATMRYREGELYFLDESVVAANHVHAVVTPAEGCKLSSIVQSWKSCAARRIGKGPLWQKESYDHIVRDLEDLERIRRYIRAHREWRPRDAASA